ncbi:hypothetical protein [Variovorax paradoxus]|uniref:hypothetical protein n=1 Tax=Variovorax paradoxus TaxID=34073 RepID=UPI003D65D88C
MLLKDDMDKYWARAQSHVHGVLLPMAIRCKCFPHGTTADDLEKQIVDPTAFPRERRPSNPRFRAAEAIRLLSGTCQAGLLLSSLEAKLCGQLGDILMGNDRVVAMEVTDEQFLQGHADFLLDIRGFRSAIGRLSHSHPRFLAAQRPMWSSRGRGIGEQTTGKVEEEAPKYMHLSCKPLLVPQPRKTDDEIELAHTDAGGFKGRFHFSLWRSESTN